MLELRVLQPDDQPSLEAFLLPRIASSMFLLGNSRVAGLCDRGERLQGTYAAAFEDGTMVGVVAHFWNGNTILQAEHHGPALCRHAVRESQRPLVGLLGPSAQVASLLAAFAIEPAQLRLDSIESLFHLPLERLRIPPELASGAVRARLAREDDLPLVARWRAAYAVEALHEDDTPELLQSTYESERISIDARCLWLAERDSGPVAMTGFNALLPEAVQIGGVYTPEPLRSRGYARVAVAQSLLDARASGRRSALLFTGDDNPAAQRAYLALGFERIGDYRLSMLEQPLTAASVAQRAG
jgi:RimJ/RimL family protein N-acetyltransferase